MKLDRNKIVSLLIGSAIFCLLFIPSITDAQAIKTTVKNIFSNPDRYDGKMVQVEGKVLSLKSKISKRGNPYTTLKITQADNSLSVFSFGTLSVKDGDSVKVMGRYQRVKQVGRYTFYNEIDASQGSV
jgi:hypothetical protein